MPKLKSREYRDCTITIQEGAPDEGAFLVRGYAFKWAPYPLYEYDGETIYEEFKRDAFADTDMSDIIMQLNHQGTVMARLRNNTLKLTLDDVGGFIEADLSKSQDARNLYEAIDNGLIDRMSWGFIPGDYHFDRNTKTIVHTRIKKIFDVSAVSMPANDTTEINSVREFADGEIAKFTQELREQEDMKLKTITRLKIGGFING
jgi:HK97 family phage prohead protease